MALWRHKTIIWTMYCWQNVMNPCGIKWPQREKRNVRATLWLFSFSRGFLSRFWYKCKFRFCWIKKIEFWLTSHGGHWNETALTLVDRQSIMIEIFGWKTKWRWLIFCCQVCNWKVFKRNVNEINTGTKWSLSCYCSWTCQTLSWNERTNSLLMSLYFYDLIILRSICI